MGRPVTSDPAAGSPATSRHVSRKREQRINKILHTAALTFAELGYDQANLEEIAARLYMRGPSLYYYFSSKDDLLIACLDHTAAAVTGRARESAAGPGSARQVLRRLLADQVLVQIRDFPEFMPLFMRLQVPNPEVSAHIRRLRRDHGDVYRHVVDEGVRRGEFAAEDSHRALLNSFGAVAYVQEWYRPGRALDAEQLAQDIADQLMRMFRRPRRRT
jgi:AcrR family transcriptional regulator